MKFLFFLAIVGAVFLWLRSLLGRQGAPRDVRPAGQDSGYAGGPVDSYANPCVPRDEGCRSSPDAEAPGASGGGDSDGGGGGGD
jgi:hypothetical protein